MTKELTLYHTLRANGNMSKTYIQNQLEAFMPLYIKHFNRDDIEEIDVCKQDSRGCLSISIKTKNGCLSHQRHFITQAELMAFVEGFMFTQPIHY